MGSRRRGYMAYLLRLWQVDEGDDAPWRASLESTLGDERRSFAGLAELFAFLEKACLATQGQSSPSVGEKGGDSDR